MVSINVETKKRHFKNIPKKNAICGLTSIAMAMTDLVRLDEDQIPRKNKPSCTQNVKTSNSQNVKTVKTSKRQNSKTVKM